MRKATMAHGDLSGEQVMVRNDGSLVLIDYDGVYIPPFHNLLPVVGGQGNYQHPEMEQRPFDEHMDTFSAYVIYIALLALWHRPELWKIYTFHSPEGRLLNTNMLFTRDDFLNPARSPLFTDLRHINDPLLNKALTALQQACSQSIEHMQLRTEALGDLAQMSALVIDIPSTTNVEKESTEEQQKNIANYGISVYGQVKGLILGEHNAITITYQNNTERVIPFLAPPRPLHNLVGRDELMQNLKQRLFRGGNLSLSALNGLPGVGKTALALALAHDHEILEHFYDGVLWAGLGRESNVLSNLNIWGIALGITQSELEKLTSLSTLTQILHGAIGIRKMLLVIDDAWSVEAAQAFKLGGPNCAHVVTTRFPEVAERFASEGTMMVQELDEYDGLTLLEQLAPGMTKTIPNEAWELIRAVGGLPLPLTLMGNYLRMCLKAVV
jgi:NB-ARC domain